MAVQKFREFELKGFDADTDDFEDSEDYACNAAAYAVYRQWARGPYKPWSALTARQQEHYWVLAMEVLGEYDAAFRFAGEVEHPEPGGQQSTAERMMPYAEWRKMKGLPADA